MLISQLVFIISSFFLVV